MTYQLIETKTVGTGVSNIEFVSIPQTFTDLLFVASIRTSRAAVDDELGFRYNGDTGTNYQFRRVQGLNNGNGYTDSNTLSFGFFGAVNGNSSTSNTFGNLSFYLPNYTGSTQKNSSMDAAIEDNSVNGYTQIMATRYTQTTAISSINIYSLNSASFATGTTISLYGITRGSSNGVVVS